MPDKVYTNDPDAGPYRNMYRPSDLLLTKVKDTMVSNRLAQGWMDALPTITVTGTAISGGVLESAIVTGGEILIFTIEGGQWDSDVITTLEAGDFSVLMDGSASGAGSFDNEFGTVEGDVHTSNTVLTVTLPAAASYAISGDETVTFNVPYSLLSINGMPITATGNVTCSPTTFVITNEA